MMATQTQTAIPTAADPGSRPTSGSGLVPYRLTVRQFEKMIDAGILRDEDHVELLGGLLVDKMKKNPPHNYGVGSLGERLRKLVEPEWIIIEEKSIVLGRFSRPEPDLVIARAPIQRYRSRSPGVSDLGVVIEVADTSYAKDRGKKWQKYAAAGITIYWIVNLPQRQVEVYSSPSGKGKLAKYRDVENYGPDEVPVIVDGREVGRIKVSDVLP